MARYHNRMLDCRAVWVGGMGVPTMQGPPLFIVALATIICLAPSGRAQALPLSSALKVPVVFEQVSCRAPPWYRGWETLAPYVCADFWWWPRYYYRGAGMRYRHHYRTQ